MQGLKRFVGVDKQQANNEDICRKIVRAPKMDARVPIDSEVFMQKRALGEYLAGSGFTEVVKFDGRQYTKMCRKELIEALTPGIELASSAARGIEGAFQPRNAR